MLPKESLSPAGHYTEAAPEARLPGQGVVGVGGAVSIDISESQDRFVLPVSASPVLVVSRTARYYEGQLSFPHFL